MAAKSKKTVAKPAAQPAPKGVPVAWIRIEDYKTIKNLMIGGALPDSFHLWLAAANQELMKAQTKGGNTERVMIRPDEYAAWCDANKKKRDKASLQAYAEAVHK